MVFWVWPCLSGKSCIGICNEIYNEQKKFRIYVCVSGTFINRLVEHVCIFSIFINKLVQQINKKTIVGRPCILYTNLQNSAGGKNNRQSVLNWEPQKKQKIDNQVYFVLVFSTRKEFCYRTRTKRSAQFVLVLVRSTSIGLKTKNCTTYYKSSV